MRDVEIPNWLKGLPLAPEFRPTDTEFADPIAYISRIEKEASAFGICKVIPPLPKPSKKYVISNLNKALSKCPELGPNTNLAEVCSSSKTDSGNGANDGEARAVFTTRHQELGQNARTIKKVVRKQVWQSGQIYTLEQFESKSKAFAHSQFGMVKDLSPLVIEALFWKAAFEKPINIEYANDVPGSGFGEPEGSFQYFYRQRRRRKRTFNRNSGASCDSKKYQVNNTSNNGENKGVSIKNSSTSFRETSRVSISLPTTLSNQTSGCSRQKSSSAANEMEGTAGWKLSNSPWNLQVIACSPGSLTHFMPDDIPGVTSPMVYIGMLFSWFAWHVEDHELHSLNFLHTGSPKTWYAVPGDYAFSFEEVICNQAYGGNIDRSASLTLLGEKTTLLSPEVVVESGIPCCRLIQNPGEFVVTFPRAYHVGFSHGFNCGEAANFGTSKWLEVAKEAAVRRAAMNYLPMLSHQQLLYLLTMSFVSRVPRSLMPGARKSRLRDCQKEQRELSVKKAFLEDILSENYLLSILLGKKSSYHAVLWDLESLPSPSKESEMCIATVVITPREDICSENTNDHDIFSERSLHVEAMNDLYVDDDDLSCDFEVDSRTLACVACGILGFPFMCVVQPSERVSMTLLQDVGVSKPLGCHSHPVLHDMIEGFVSDGLKDKIEQNESNVLHHPNGASSSAKSIKSMAHSSDDLSSVPDLFPPPEDLPVSLEVKFDKGWSATRGFLRPRIFCLEHAIQIEDMLRSKGGANFFVICHSDFQKMKAHAAVIAEEIGSPFRYNEIPLDNASQEDLNLIDLAIDDEEHDECGEDRTSKLSINLRRCVKVRKNSPSKQVQHPMGLGGLFSGMCPSSNTFNLKWPSRKSRSKRNSNHSVHMKPSESIQMEKDEVLGAESDGIMVRREGELIQYSRRFKSKPGDSAAASKIFEHPAKHVHNEVSVTNPGGPDESSKHNEKNYAEKSAGSLSIAVESTENFEIQRENQITEEITMKNVACADDSEGQCNIQSDGDVLTKEAPDLVNTMNTDEMLSSLENCSSRDKIDLGNRGFTMVCPRSTAQNGRKRRIDVELQTEDQLDFNCFIKSPCERLRPRAAKDAKSSGIDRNNMFKDKPAVKSVRKSSNDFLSCKNKRENENVKESHRCDLEGCRMKFQTKADLLLHKRNQCPHKGCGKKFSSHKYAVIHQRVHDDNRPLKCPWKGCTMTFKWAWARTEHLRVHTGERPYQCKVEGCGLTFRFVSDFSRHRRKTGHYVNVPT